MQSVAEHIVLQERDRLDFNKKFKNPDCEKNPFFLGLALAGEAGEVANVLKKEIRDNSVMQESLESEMADVYVYLLLLAKTRGVDSLDRITIKKLREVAQRHEQGEDASIRKSVGE